MDGKERGSDNLAVQGASVELDALISPINGAAVHSFSGNRMMIIST